MFMNCVSCTQHIVALSIILACRHLIAEHLKLLPDDTKFSDISEEFLVDLQYHGPKILIKWPNDIYVIDDNYSCDSDQDVNSKLLQHKIIGKLGGLLVHCRLVDLNHAELLIGCGINAFNEIPTISFRQILMKSHQDYMEPNFSIAKLIALVVSYVERILMKLHGSNSNYNLEWVLSLYTKCWIHTNQKVKIYPNLSMSNESDIETVQQSTNDTNTYQIVGVDNYGYLLVKDLCTGIKHQLHPDGNSMDMMRGLIMAK
ncbi:Biotin--protein ligase [Schistosoma japonicum]|nr:Biotin--protein ligase [Schistosoma japonicum]